MTDGLSRRNLMLLAGAGATLAACKARGSGPGDQLMFGRWPTHGKPTKPGPKYDTGASGPDFRPNWITLVHIDFPPSDMLTVNHACYYFPKDEGERLRRAIHLFGLKRPAMGPKKRFAALEGNDKPYKRFNQWWDFDDFNKFGFASQHEIFFFFDSPHVTLDDDWLISFSPASDKGKPRDHNYSFFNTTSVPAVLHGGGTSVGSIVRVRNYFTDPSGRSIDPDDTQKLQTYSMNLHFRYKNIPMILDPDTGNGTGHEP